MGRKKSSFVASIFTGIGRAIAWIIVNTFKAIWFLLVGIFKGAKAATKATASAAKKAHYEAKVRSEQPKTPAKYDALRESNAVKGSIETFEQRLFNESLILAVAGRRGSGKSVLGFRIMENIHAKTGRPCFALGVRQGVLPSWIVSIDEINQVSNRGVVLVDEGAITFSSRESMSKSNRGLGSLLAIARHKDLTLIFITQNTGMIDKNVLNLCDTVVLKEGSLLQEKMERSVMKDLYQTANSAISKIPASERKTYCYIFDADYEGLAQASLPSFWSTKVSKNQA
ncbi:MAG: zonular occludens toxin domain-containing protein [Candidatus Woesearchaeota archaeon]